ncbi:hypothetical protein [Kiloniella sp. b19]|uniref:hypothetical protein n=1 Tax=Kiloniella sp. GXU_MW_B19 TaxID=3141326 RepID=UPI0031D0874D
MNKILALLLTPLFSLLLLQQEASAQATPNHVYQTVETLNSQLEQIIKANMLAIPDAKTPEKESRKPRHVYQKARTIYSILQTYRKLNGLEARALPNIPAEAIKPAEVQKLVQQTLTDTVDIARLYQAPLAETTALPDGKKPDDVYVALTRTLELLQVLDVPRQQPNDVYQIAATIMNVMEEIAQARGITDYDKASNIIPGKTPEDVFKQAGGMLDMLRIEKPLFEMPNGAATYTVPKTPITPQEANEIMGLLLADLTVVKRNAGVTTATQYAALEGGKNPNDVFERISTSYLVLLWLLGE